MKFAKTSVYDSAFYSTRLPGSLTSANIVLREVLTEDIASLVDLGGGTGAWGRVALDLGLADTLVVDGRHVLGSDLKVPPEHFVSHDLTTPLTLDRKFDICLCLEVAEHLGSEDAGTLVSSMTRHSDMILFSAAIPGQGGTGHVNEQWPAYWYEKFREVGFDCYDVLREELWEQNIDWWYAQNSLIYCREGSVAYERLWARRPPGRPRALVHPGLYQLRSQSWLPAEVKQRFKSSYDRAAVWLK